MMSLTTAGIWHLRTIQSWSRCVASAASMTLTFSAAERSGRSARIVPASSKTFLTSCSAAARSGQFSSMPIATSKTFWPAEAALAMTICSYSDQAKPPIACVAPLRRSNGA